jgi:peptide subunit release factor 1 (eRF1)
MDINRPDGALINELIPYYRNAREDSVHEIFDQIKIECLRNGLGAHGLEAVFEAVKQARVETAIIDREFRPDGWRCKSCESVWHKEGPTCPECDSIEIFKVDMVNELIQKLKQTDARVLFYGPDPAIEAGGRRRGAFEI